MKTIYQMISGGGGGGDKYYDRSGWFFRDTIKWIRSQIKLIKLKTLANNFKSKKEKEQSTYFHIIFKQTFFSNTKYKYIFIDIKI